MPKIEFQQPSSVSVEFEREAKFYRIGHTLVVEVDGVAKEVGVDLSVSKRHATIYLRDGKFYIRDLGSCFGTFVNGKPIRSEFELSDGDEVRIGSNTFFTVKLTPLPSSCVDSTIIAVENLCKLCLTYAELDKKSELLKALLDLKVYAGERVDRLERAIKLVELMMREGVQIGKDFVEELDVLLHEIRRENEI